MPIISVIIPVYNVESYLHNCLDSILHQSFSDWEAIIVDDGSQDHSAQICDDYALKDSRFRVIHKSNEGVSTARNLGLEKASGSWICFVDSDDMLTPDALQYMYQRLEETEADVCLCPIVGEQQNIQSSKVLTKEERDELIWRCLAYRTDKYVPLGFMVDAPHGKLFRSSIIKENNIRFIEGLSKSEDAIFDVDFYHHCKNIVMDTHAVYRYSVNPNSICHTFNWKSIGMLTRVLREESLFIDMYYKDNCYFQDALNIRAFVGLQQLINESGTKGLSFSQHIKAIRQYLKDKTVQHLLSKLQQEKLLSEYPHRQSVVELRLARSQYAFILYTWVTFNQVIFRCRVKLIEGIKKLLCIKPTESISTIFNRCR